MSESEKNEEILLDEDDESIPSNLYDEDMVQEDMPKPLPDIDHQPHSEEQENPESGLEHSYYEYYEEILQEDQRDLSEPEEHEDLGIDNELAEEQDEYSRLIQQSKIEVEKSKVQRVRRN